MKLMVYNGSPRGEHGNTPLLMSQFLTGYTAVPGNTFHMYHLAYLYQAETFAAAFNEADAVILAFPLYCDAMPGLVKAFIESLEPYCGRTGNPPIGFVIQSGFPESLHLRPLEVYLNKLARRLGSPYLGTVVRGGVEGIREQSEKSNRSLFKAFQNLGHSFGETGQLDPQQVRAISQMERLPGWIIPFLYVMDGLGLTKINWIQQLRRNGVYNHRFAMPYLDRKD